MNGQESRESRQKENIDVGLLRRKVRGGFMYNGCVTSKLYDFEL